MFNALSNTNEIIKRDFVEGGKEIMYDYAFDVDLARFAIVIGLFITILFYERLKIAPGGMVVPGYIALFINHPEQIFYTFLLAFLVYLFVSKILMKHMILFGRRRFTITVLTGAIFVITTEVFVHSYLTFQPFIGFEIIGIIIPGLIANEFVRENKPFYVLIAISFISLLTFGFIWTTAQIYWLLSLKDVDTFLLGLFIVDLLLLTATTIYLLFLFNWEKYVDKGNNTINTIKVALRNGLHLERRGGSSDF